MPRMKDISEPIAPSRIKRNRRDKSACPFCSARIKRKTATSRMKSCEACKAQKDNASDLNCCKGCLLYTSPSPRDATLSRMPSSA